MKTNFRWAWAVAVVFGATVLTARTEEAAVVKRNRVNVRAQAVPTSEVITQLKKGESVIVLEEITPKKRKRGEPATWAKIQLPPNTPVWVYGPYIETNNHTVNIKRLNLRAGPGENFSVIGRLDRGTEVKEIRTDGNWMEIEAPTNAFAFVAAAMLEKTAAPVPPATELAANTNTPPAQPAPTVETVKPELVPAPAVETASPAATAQPTPQPTTPTPAPPADTTPPKRVVSREGTVVVSRSIQAPTSYALENRESRKTVNYLHSESEDINLKKFAGKKVIVTGEELIDQRWTSTPIIEVESIQVVP
ncbi:MAG TPA: SH3 domain-containing protein [Candidatus Angelobacter sp.]|nr:SH3 domain-containing protein [Candidatus Angelobacter sp.]